jgi:hypothetical protein
MNPFSIARILAPAKLLYIFLYMFSTATLVLLWSGCGSPVIQEYVEATAVQGYLIVGEPMTNILISRTGEVQDSFALTKQVISDADVRIRLGSREFRLTFQRDGTGGTYALADTSVKVLPDTVYSLSIRLQSGQELTATTRTPPQIQWTRSPRPIIQYPKDSTNFATPDSLGIAWKRVGNQVEYIIGVRCLDTLNYGKYLNPKTAEGNRRTYRPPFLGGAGGSNPERTDWTYTQGTGSRLTWTDFRWFGAHEVTIYAPDQNFVNWYKLTRFGGSNPQYNPLLGSVKGGYGVFGSASVARTSVLLLKNQP